jgi:hypothetical protein
MADKIKYGVFPNPLPAANYPPMLDITDSPAM